jgi:hypothetical protein
VLSTNSEVRNAIYRCQSRFPNFKFIRGVWLAMANTISAITNKLQYIWETGLIDYWMRKYRPNIDKCVKIDKLPSRNAPLKLADLSSAFFLLSIGLFFSIVLVIGEILCFEKEAFAAEILAYVYWVVGLVSLLFQLLGRILLAMNQQIVFYFWRGVRIIRRG